MNPKISVIVPVYKAEKYLHKCVDSVLAQTFTDFELLLVDDGSPDHSGDICDEYAAKDSRVKVFHNKNNGAGFSRKFGVNNATGEYVMFVDGDDTLPLNAIMDLIIENPTDKYDIVVGNMYINNVLFQHTVTGELTGEEYACAILRLQTSVGPVGKLYKKELFVDLIWENPKFLIQNEDLFMLILLSMNVHRVYIAQNIVVYNYLWRPGTASSQLMSIDGWKYIFSNFNLLFHKSENESLLRSFAHYEVNSLFRYCVLRGMSIEDISFIYQKEYITGFNDKLKFYIIENICLQKTLYCVLQTLIRTKRNIKNLKN